MQRRDRASGAKSQAAQAPPPAPRPEAARAGAPVAESGEDKELEASEPSTESDASYDVAMVAYRDGRYTEAERRFDEVVSLGGPHAANAALYAVQASSPRLGLPDCRAPLRGGALALPGLGRQ